MQHQWLHLKLHVTAMMLYLSFDDLSISEAGTNIHDLIATTQQHLFKPEPLGIALDLWIPTVFWPCPI